LPCGTVAKAGKLFKTTAPLIDEIAKEIFERRTTELIRIADQSITTMLLMLFDLNYYIIVGIDIL
jgi:hypothetical protein